MDRREQLERIILGTLLRTTENTGMEHWNSCRNCITEDMFRSEKHRKIYALVSNALKFHGKSSLYDLFTFFPDKVSTLMDYIANLSVFWDFETKKMNYNENAWLKSMEKGGVPKYTNVMFDDYVSEFIKFVFKP